MVLVRVNFRLASKHWSREFTADDGTSVQSFKELMLRSKGGADDLHCFELRRDRQRVPDNLLLWEDCGLDFKFLGADRGARRASRDAAESAAAKAVGANPKAITLENVLSLQADLMEGFGRPAFQKQLDDIAEKHRDNERKFHAERQKLFLTVQKVVLPKWGFAGTPKGVFEMMTAMSQPQFNISPDFQRQGWFLNKLLRLAPAGAEPPPDLPPAPGKPQKAEKAKRDEMLRLMGEIAGTMESAEFRQSLDLLAARCDSKQSFWKARGEVIYLVYAAVLPRYRREVSTPAIADLWTALSSFRGDAELQKVKQRIEPLMNHDGDAPVTDGQGDQFTTIAERPFAGCWSDTTSPKVYVLVQLGSGLVASCPDEDWTPARGTIKDGHATMESPEIIKGYLGKLHGDRIDWISGDPWYRHTETAVVVRHGRSGEEVSLQAPAGLTLAGLREALGALDKRLQVPDLQFAHMEGSAEPLQDGLVITSGLCKFRVLPRGGEPVPKVDEVTEKHGTQEALAEAPAEKLNLEDVKVQLSDDKLGTPRTGGELFDFHDLPDDES